MSCLYCGRVIAPFISIDQYKPGETYLGRVDVIRDLKKKGYIDEVKPYRAPFERAPISAATEGAPNEAIC